MANTLTRFVQWAIKFGAVALVANEIRGLILALPVLYAMYEAGGSLMAIWLGVCSLGGILLSVIVPMFVIKRAGRMLPQQQPA